MNNLGLFKELDYRKVFYPKGFELELKNHDPKDRQRAIHD